ncbi:hypothetical protein V494_07313 [Pseudogymnoascus sp. VKM F-4513 (FW-928)]|nr:hypothetical protein V494_07313 [Pseudogymnoascus sp. VKM F-4513 (FW-928)]
MASNSPPSQWPKGDLWDTDPNTFIAREAVKRLDLKECYLTDDAIMKFLINRREKTIKGKEIFEFNETEFVKGGFLRSRHKGRGAPALAPDGTVMTALAGAHHNSTIVLDGGDRSLLSGSWSIENYQAKSDHPGYKEWLAKIKWTTGDALRAGIPLTSINTTLTSPATHVQQNLSAPEKKEDELQEKDDSPQPSIADNLTNQGQAHNATNFTNQGQEPITPPRSVTPQEALPQDTPSEYATLSPTHSGITISNPTTPEPSRSEANYSKGPASGIAASESSVSKPVTSEPIIEEPVTSEPITSQSAIAEPISSVPAVSEPLVTEPTTSATTSSEPTAPKPNTSEPVASESDIAQPTISEPAVSEPATSLSTITEPVTQDLATSEPATVEPVASEPVTLNLSTPHPVALGLTNSDPVALEPLAAKHAAIESTIFELETSQATVPQLAAAEPAALQHFVSEPGASAFTIAAPTASEPATFGSASSELATPEPVISRPTVIESVASRFTIPETAALERCASVPITTEPRAPELATSKSIASQRATSELATVKPSALETTPLVSLSFTSIHSKTNSLEDTKPDIMQSQSSVSVQQQSGSPSTAVMKLESDPPVGLGIDTGLMEQTTPKHSASMFRQQFTPREPSLEIPGTPETVPPPAQDSKLAEAHITQNRTPAISLKFGGMMQNQASMSAGKRNLRHPSVAQPSSAASGTIAFQSPPATPVSSRSLKRKATEPLDLLITFHVGDGKPEAVETFNFSERKLVENAPEFYELFKSRARRVKNTNGRVYDIFEKPKLFEAMLHWIDKRQVVPKSYSAPHDLECYYLDLYLAAANYVLPGFSNAIIDKLYDWHSTGTVRFQMIDKVYSMTRPGCGLRNLYFGCMMALSTEEFEATQIEEPEVMVDLFAMKKAFWGGMEAKEFYRDI